MTTLTKTISSGSPYDLHNSLVSTIEFSKKSFVVMGKLLSELYRGDAYKEAVGTGIDTWVEYITQPEIGLSKGEASRLISIYEEFVERLGFSEDYIASIPVKNIHYLLPMVKSMDGNGNVDVFLEDARVLSQKDFRERVYDIKNDDNGARTYEYLIMQKCIETGTLQKVHDISSKLIESKFNLNG